MHAQEILGVVDTHGVKELENPPQTELFPANLDIKREMNPEFESQTNLEIEREMHQFESPTNLEIEGEIHQNESPPKR
jgi:hypothetical protein